MKPLREWLSLSARDRGLLLRAALLLGGIRVGLWLLSFATLRRLLARLGQPAGRGVDREQVFVERVAWAVGVAGRHVPWDCTCLPRALAAQVLLARGGCPARLRIGVARNAARQLQAHAWVESRGNVVVGNLEDLARYVPLPLDGAANGRG